MEIIDISWPIESSMTEYKDAKSVKIDAIKKMEKDGARAAHVSMNNHTGTHIDAPAHFLPDGSTIDVINLSTCIGRCRVIDCTAIKTAISAEDLVSIPIQSDEIVLFKTANSFHATTDSFDYNFIYLAASGAEYLSEKNIKAVGIDYLGIERNQPGHETHTILMKKNIPIIEGLRLAQVNPGIYWLWCLPLLIKGIDAAPARAILIKQ